MLHNNNDDVGQIERIDNRWRFNYCETEDHNHPGLPLDGYRAKPYGLVCLVCQETFCFLQDAQFHQWEAHNDDTIHACCMCREFQGSGETMREHYINSHDRLSETGQSYSWFLEKEKAFVDELIQEMPDFMKEILL